MEWWYYAFINIDNNHEHYLHSFLIIIRNYLGGKSNQSYGKEANNLFSTYARKQNKINFISINNNKKKLNIIGNIISVCFVLIIRKAFHSLMQSIKSQNNRYTGLITFSIDIDTDSSNWISNEFPLLFALFFYYWNVATMEEAEAEQWCMVAAVMLYKICKLIAHKQGPDIK